MPIPQTTLLPLSELVVSLVDRKRAEMGLRPLTIAELHRLGRQVAAILFPACMEAEPGI